MLAAAHQSGDTTGGGVVRRAAGILMATTAAIGGVLATTNQVDSARNLILSESHSDNPLSGLSNIPAPDTNQTNSLDQLDPTGGLNGAARFEGAGNSTKLPVASNNLHNNDHDYTTSSPLSSSSPSVLVAFSGWDMLLISVLISIILISIIGNCLVCVAIFTDRRLRKLGNAFIVSLAIADLFVSCLVMTFALCNDLMNYWMFGEWFCDIWISFDIMCCTASILNLCAISLDRFIHIKDCLLYNQLMTKRVAISAVIIIWIISALVSFVPINLGWHKPNHFKQPALNYGQHRNNSNPYPISSTPQMPTDLEYHYDDAAAAAATTEDDNKLALLDHEQGEHMKAADRHKMNSAGGRHKRQATTEHSIMGTRQTSPCNNGRRCTTSAGPSELNDKISEIRTVEVVANWAAGLDDQRSQISNKLRKSAANSQHRAGGLRQRVHRQSLLLSGVGMQATGSAPIDNNHHHRLDEARSAVGRADHHLQGNASRPTATWARGLPSPASLVAGAWFAREQANLVAQVPSGSLDGNNLNRRRAPDECDDVDDDDDESKQRRQAAAAVVAFHALHKNELFDQVAPPPESNPEQRQNCRHGHRRPEHTSSPALEQIKHLPPSDQMLNRRQSGPQLDGSPAVAVASLGAHSGQRKHARAANSAATNSRTKRSPGELNGRHQVQTNRPQTTTTTATTSNGETPDKVHAEAVDARATFAEHRSGSPQDDHDGDNEMRPTATAGEPRQQTANQKPVQSRSTPRQQRASSTTTTSSKAPASPSELPQCMLTLTPTYAVISSTISFYIPCIIMLGLYSKLFACARRHVRNIKAISKAPQPIGFGSPPAAGQTTDAISILNDCARDQTGNVAGNEIVNGRQSNATSASSRRDLSSSLPSTGNSQTGTGNSIGMQCRARLARFVRRPELKLGTKSRTWIKVGTRSSGASTLKPNQTGAGDAELALSTSEDVAAETDALHVGAVNQKTGQSGCGPILNKLNSNISKQNAQTTATTSYNATDYNGDDGNDHDKTNAHGNETEPFLNGPDSQQGQQEAAASIATLPNSARLQVRPGADDALAGQINGPPNNDLSIGDRDSPKAKRNRHKALTVAKSAPAFNCELNPSRTDANVGSAINQAPKIITTTYTTIGDITPTKLNVENNHHHHHHPHPHQHQNNSWHQQQRQQQQQHHYLQQQQAQSNKQQTSQLATHKAAITLGIIMGTFLFCWVPFFCLNIIKAYHGDSIPSSLFRAFTWLGYANSALNPIIYGIHNSEFRNAFNRIFFKHLTLKNGRQYLNRRFSYDLRQHHPNQQQQHNRQQHQSRRNHDNQGQQHGPRHGPAATQQQSQFLLQNQRLISSASQTPTTTCEKDMTYSQTQLAGCDETTIQQDSNMSKQQQQQQQPKPTQQHHRDRCEVQP